MVHRVQIGHRKCDTKSKVEYVDSKPEWKSERVVNEVVEIDELERSKEPSRLVFASNYDETDILVPTDAGSSRVMAESTQIILQGENMFDGEELTIIQLSSNDDERVVPGQGI
ncbi:hypothetical protein GOBAR_AA33755 [Gossypium barbadense]|uniref:Uncharacterized protein n=1 Tax=Gossypium barbadense TaxID=3634 RepID=A0A2P5W783_GOSBA|nr:hypothetical protein GOBAR_AA33755 [Gossypium barbadense]